jgi:hypothetical protein
MGVGRRNDGGHYRRLCDGQLAAVYKITTADDGSPLSVDVTVRDAGPAPRAAQRVQDEYGVISG